MNVGWEAMRQSDTGCLLTFSKGRIGFVHRFLNLNAWPLFSLFSACYISPMTGCARPNVELDFCTAMPIRKVWSGVSSNLSDEAEAESPRHRTENFTYPLGTASITFCPVPKVATSRPFTLTTAFKALPRIPA